MRIKDFRTCRTLPRVPGVIQEGEKFDRKSLIARIDTLSICVRRAGDIQTDCADLVSPKQHEYKSTTGMVGTQHDRLLAVLMDRYSHIHMHLPEPEYFGVVCVFL